MRQALHLRGLVAIGTDRQPVTHPHNIVSLGPFDAVISPFDQTSLAQDQAAEALTASAMVHHEILQGYCADAALLPMQFGAVFSSVSALFDAMKDKSQLYLDALAVLEKHREFSVTLETARASPQQEIPATTGRAFLNDKKRLRNKRRDLTQNRLRFANDLRQQLSELSAQPIRTHQIQQDRLLDTSLLVSLDRLTQLRQSTQSAGAQAADLGLRLRVLGPWPAYHFDLKQFEQEVMCHGA